METQLLFVQGVQKTGTSTLVGILNCHPDIFMMYEVALHAAKISTYGNQLLARYPDCRRYFRNTAEIERPYRELAEHLNRLRPPGKPYTYFGDKLISFDTQLTSRGDAHRTIFCVRDIRTWLCKEQVVRYYRSDLDVVPVAVDYLRYLIGTRAHPNSVRVKLEDMVGANERVLVTLNRFLGVDVETHAVEWWNRIGRHDVRDPKSALKWFAGHASSRVAPGRLDTSIEIRSHPFWEEIDHWIAKYYASDDSQPLPSSNIERDLEAVEALMKYSPLRLDRC
jgi:hypothetical protein